MHKYKRLSFYFTTAPYSRTLINSRKLEVINLLQVFPVVVLCSVDEIILILKSDHFPNKFILNKKRNFIDKKYFFKTMWLHSCVKSEYQGSTFVQLYQVQNA